MKRIGVIAAFIFLVSPGALWAQEKVVVGGSGGLFDEVKEIVKIYQAKNPSHQIEITAESIPTNASIEATKAGRLTIGLVGRPLRDEERGKLVYRPVARVPVGIGVHKSNPVGSLSESQVCGVFSGRVKSWREVGGGDGKIVVLAAIPKNDVFSGALRKQMACFTDLKVSPEAIVLNRVLEVLDALNHRPGTIGIISISADMNSTRPNLKAISVGGVFPSAEALQSGKYNYFHEYGIITIGEPQGVAKRFLEFMTNSESHKILARGGITPVR